MSEFLKELPQYHFDRRSFTDVFYEVFGGEITDLYEACISNKRFGDFLLYYDTFEEFYIIHFPSGTIINWYKHLGRTNTCNKEGFTLEDLKEMVELLKEAMKEYLEGDKE